MQKDLDTISGRFFDLEFGKEQSFIKKYFKSDVAIAVIRYWLVFGDLDRFAQHAGIYVKREYAVELIYKYFNLLKNRQQFKKAMNFELFWTVEAGKFREKVPKRYLILKENPELIKLKQI